MKKNTPKIRFMGFTDDWEQRKFDDSFSFPVSTNSLSRAMLNYDSGEIKSIHYGDILIKYPSILDIRKEEIPFITKGTLEKYKESLLENGDLIFADAAEDETVGKAVEIHGITDEYIVSGLHTIVARASPQNAKYFLGYYINSDNYHRQLLRLMQGSKVSAISKSNLQKTQVTLPKEHEEQRKIGYFFRLLDNILTLHQRKLEKLKQLKQAYLQQLFPQNGENTPRIRFANFENKWEQDKFGNLIKEKREKTKIENEDTLLSCAIDGIYLNSELFDHFRGTSNIGYLKIKMNDMILSAQNLHLGNANINLRFEHGMISPAYKVYNLTKAEPHFMSAWLKAKSTKNFFERATTEGASVCRKNILWNDLYKQDLFVPSFTEQQKIGSFFKQLDDIITIHQSKLDKLNSLKQALLQKIFV